MFGSSWKQSPQGEIVCLGVECYRGAGAERTPRWEDKRSHPDLFITHEAPAVKAVDAMLRRQGSF